MKNVSILALKMIKPHTRIKVDILSLSPPDTKLTLVSKAVITAVSLYAGIPPKRFNLDLQNSPPLLMPLIERGIFSQISCKMCSEVFPTPRPQSLNFRLCPIQVVWVLFPLQGCRIKEGEVIKSIKKRIFMKVCSNHNFFQR